jgi:GTPase SAR1 family protein
MGACGSTPDDGMNPEERQRNKDLEAKMAADAKKESEKIKLLLLGAGESGKSTIFKQMKLIYGEKFSEAERKANVPVVHNNIVSAIKTLVDQTTKLGITDGVLATKAFETISSIDENEPITVDIGGSIQELWADPGIQETWKRRSEYQIIEAVQYYFNKVAEIKMPMYLPSDDDILYCRIRTSGIVTETYLIDGATFEMYDVGGQRNERKKWIHCFEGVTAVIFVAAISEYDQVLFEDATTNRMVEAFNLFADVCNNSFFERSSMILFLNKRDLFEKKIQVKNIRDYPVFEDYNGPDNDYDNGVNYFVSKFLELNKSGSKQIYHHVTCATDTQNVKVVFDACKDIILRQNLVSSGFL